MAVGASFFSLILTGWREGRAVISHWPSWPAPSPPTPFLPPLSRGGRMIEGSVGQSKQQKHRLVSSRRRNLGFWIGSQWRALIGWPRALWRSGWLGGWAGAARGAWGGSSAVKGRRRSAGEETPFALAQPAALPPLVPLILRWRRRASWVGPSRLRVSLPFAGKTAKAQAGRLSLIAVSLKSEGRSQDKPRPIEGISGHTSLKFLRVVRTSFGRAQENSGSIGPSSPTFVFSSTRKRRSRFLFPCLRLLPPVSSAVP